MYVGRESTRFIEQPTDFSKKISEKAQRISGKIEQTAANILFSSKNSLNKLADNITGTAQFIGSRTGIGTDKQTKDMLAVYRKSVQGPSPKSQTLQASSNLSSQIKTGLSKDLILFQNEKALGALSKNLTTELTELRNQKLKAEEDPKNHYFSGEDKEKLGRLELLQVKLNEDPVYLAEKMHDYRNDPTYLHMQPVKFLSLLVKSNQMLDMAHIENPTQPRNPSGLTEKERVAVCGYSTKDYSYLNASARASNGQIKDPGMKDYFDNVKSGWNKLPKVPIPVLNKAGMPVDLKRGIEKPPSQEWIDETFVAGKEFTDHAFLSCTNDYVVQMQGTLIFKAPEVAKELPHARFLGEPYTVQGGEAEILLEPGISMKISKVEKLSPGSFRAELLLE